MSAAIETFKNHVPNQVSYELLKDLVGLDSQTRNQDGVYRAQLFIARELESLNFQIEWIDNPLVESAPLLVATRKGRSARCLQLVGHTDTVNSPDKHPFRFDCEGQKILGAGVADDKGGLVVCLGGLKKFIEYSPDHFFTIQVIVSPNEEIGSPGFQEALKVLGERADYLLGLEPASPEGNIISSRSGNRWYKLNIRGQAAHSGRFGESYMNAAHELARIVYELSDLNDEKRLARFNVGSVQSDGQGFNTICGSIIAKIDARFPSAEICNEIHQRFNDILLIPSENCPYTGKSPQILYSIEDDCPALAFNVNGGELTQWVLDSIESHEGRVCMAKHSGGAADINYMSHTHNCGLDGLGVVGGGLHTNSEYIWAYSLMTRTEVLCELLSKLERIHGGAYEC